MSKIKVLYVEDDPDWREGLQSFFLGDEKITLNACVSTIEECFTMLRDDPVDIVVMDIMLGDHKASGLDATLDISTQYPQVKVIMLSSLDDNDEIFNEAFMNGAYDYLYKNEFERLPEVICAAMHNPHSKYGDRLRKLVQEKKKSLLSEGDRHLLSMIYAGKTQTQIAKELHVSLAAVKKHVGRIMKKFNWEQSSSELADKCQKWGLLEVDRNEKG